MNPSYNLIRIGMLIRTRVFGFASVSAGYKIGGERLFFPNAGK